MPQGALLPSPALNSRFGAALVQIPDVNADGLNDLAVGAPLEDGHQGALYLYHGHHRSVRLRHTQVGAGRSRRGRQTPNDFGLAVIGYNRHMG